jgi:uracil-DNA glycosylase
MSTSGIQLEASWKNRLSAEFAQPYFKALIDFVREEYRAFTCYPPGNQIFAAFDRCRFDDLKVVILGQDPYHGPQQANGLCFSVNSGVRIPPSLNNIMKELENDIGKPRSSSGDLGNWADQGVLLLNATLTVRAGTAGSHQNKGWEIFSDAVIRKINEEKSSVVFILWGGYAGKKSTMIDASKHLILKSPHPSPLSAHQGFFGNHHFSKTNAWLAEHGLSPIAW